MDARWNPGRLFRFSLGTLLFVTLCVCGYFGGYRKGFDDGKEDLQASTVYLVTYPVGDLVIPMDGPDTPMRRQTATDDLIDLIVTTVEHDSWLENGTGEGEIQPFPANNSLVISQSGRVHDQLAELLRQLRKLRTDVDAKETIPLLQKLAATERQQGVPIRKFAGSSGAAAIEQLFDSAVASIADRWGEPEYCGAATDRDFPRWSVAQQVATWPKGEGTAYIAVQDDAENGRSLLAGWHAGE